MTWPQWTPHEGQVAFAESKAKFRAFNGGYGAGKTFAGSQEAWSTMANYPGSLGLIVAPTYPELRDYTQRTFFEAIGVDASVADTHPLVERWSKTEQHLWLRNGSEVFFRSADKPSALVGSTIDWYWLDEPASCQPVAWKHLIGRLRRGVGPRRGWATGTPKGYNWVYKEFAETERKNYALFTCSTMANAANLPQDYIDGMVESYTGVFARGNIYGEFVAFEGQVYEFSRERHLLLSDWEPNPEVGIYRVADFGVNNPTTWLWIQEIGGRVYVFDELEVRRTPVTTIAAEVRSRWTGEVDEDDEARPDLEVLDNYGDVAGTQHDSNLGSYVTNYNREGIRIHTRAGGTIRSGIEVVTRFMADGEDGMPRLMVHPRCRRLMAAFETYHWPEDVEGKRMGEEPVKDGISDHMMDTVRYFFVNAHREQFRRNAGAGTSPSAGKPDTAYTPSPQTGYSRPSATVTTQRSPLSAPSDADRMGRRGPLR